MKVFISSLFAVIIVFCSSIQSKELTADSGFATKSLSGCKSDLRYLNQVIGWQVKWPRQWQNVIASGPTAANDAMTNWSEVPTAIEQAIATLNSNITLNEKQVTQFQNKDTDLNSQLDSLEKKVECATKGNSAHSDAAKSKATQLKGQKSQATSFPTNF